MPNEDSMYRKNSDGSFSQFMELSGSNAKLEQTHNAVSIPLSSNSYGSNIWVDCAGFSDVAITLLNDAATASSVDVFWSHNASTTHGLELGALPSVTTQQRAGQIPVKARYLKLRVLNGDAATAHTMSAWVYLKV